jgi:hypothetical protein
MEKAEPKSRPGQPRMGWNPKVTGSPSVAHKWSLSSKEVVFFFLLFSFYVFSTHTRMISSGRE